MRQQGFISIMLQLSRQGIAIAAALQHFVVSEGNISYDLFAIAFPH